MRKFLIVAMLAVIALFASCDKFGVKSPGDNYDTSDSAQVAQFVNSVTNPSLLDAAEALSLKQSMLEKQSVDSAFLALPDNILNNVASVLQKKKPGGFYKKDILEEYRLCKNVYDNLPNGQATENPTSAVDRTGTDLGNRHDSIISTSYNFRTDTIDGKPVRIRITTVESYE